MGTAGGLHMIITTLSGDATSAHHFSAVGESILRLFNALAEECIREVCISSAFRMLFL